MEDRSQYLVRYPDETRGHGNGPSSYIPTIGAATTAVDQYRVVAVASTNLPEVGAAFTDVHAVAAISRVAEGGITDAEELESAETALHALLLHNVVHVLTPCPKGELQPGFISYIRQDANQRTKYGFDLFSLAESRDWIIAPEFIRCEDGVVSESTLQGSKLIGTQIGGLYEGKSYWNDSAAEALNVVAESHGIPAYFTDPVLIRSRRGDGFPKRFYHSLRQSWDKAVGDIPPIVCTFALPPLLAIVRNRVSNRSDLHVAIADLRAELAPVRAELFEFNKIVTQSTPNAEIESRVRRIVESFDAIIPESRLSGAQRRRRRILSIQSLARPLVKFAMGFATKGGATLEEGLKLADGASSMVIESKAFINRTITARTFVGLVRTDSLQALVNHHFYQSEISAIERSLRNR